MSLAFLSTEIKRALDNLNYNFLSEIRLRIGQPIIVEYDGYYKYLGNYGITNSEKNALICTDVAQMLSEAMEKCVFAYTEQLKNAFITIGGGIRIGIGGEYVTDGGIIKTVQKPTSLNIRIPHDALNCAKELLEIIEDRQPSATLIFSKPGYGKTTILRDIARQISKTLGNNVLVYDERYELSAFNESGTSYNLGQSCDVMRGADKLNGFANAIRAMKPNVLICDELYGERDFAAIKYAIDCGIRVFASTHVTDRNRLAGLPFECFVELTGIKKQAVIYDKAFNIIGNYNTFGDAWRNSDG